MSERTMAIAYAEQGHDVPGDEAFNEFRRKANRDMFGVSQISRKLVGLECLMDLDWEDINRQAAEMTVDAYMYGAEALDGRWGHVPEIARRDKNRWLAAHAKQQVSRELTEEIAELELSELRADLAARKAALGMR